MIKNRDKFKDEIKHEFKSVESEFFRTVSTMIVSSVGLVAALAWNTTITKILERYLNQPESDVWSWLFYAILVTLLAVIVTIYLGRVAKRLHTGEQKKIDLFRNKSNGRPNDQ